MSSWRSVIVVPIWALCIYVSSFAATGSGLHPSIKANGFVVQASQAGKEVAQTGCITGLVIDESGHPREHIKVEAQKPGGGWTRHETWTDANGRFQIRDLPPTAYLM